MADARTYGTEFASEDFPHGLRCIDCDKQIAEGDRYASRLGAFQGDVPIVELICLECALATPETDA